ncbi:MAG: Bax inhibitor-1/YccA family protein [Actinomycetota bacterium]|nr:Bax inhibitor-1/YccA family protein [Actinomycetota bacterium]
MANAVLAKTLEKEAGGPGWGAPTRPGGPGYGGDGPIARTDTMTLGGVLSATTLLFVILCAFGYWGWTLVEAPPETGQSDFPGWIIFAVLIGFGIGLLAMLKPPLARFLGPVYAAVQGVFLGAISHWYENQWDGIVVQAVGLTAIVFLSMLFVYSVRILRVTEKMRRVVIGATMAIAVFYLVSLLLSFLNVTMPLIWDAGPFGIAFSLFVCGLAAFNLVLDFDLAERGVAAGLPKYMEWFCALGLMISIVWLYLEILRLLSKLRR